MTTSRATARDPFPLVEQHLRSTGFRVLDQCWDTDPDPRVVIAADHDVLVACLVKTSGRRSRSGSADVINRTTVRALRRMAVAWMDSHATRFEQVRIDVIGVTIDGPGGYMIEHVRGAGEL